ncbi:hypothetical protein IQ37_12065 [Chryseobacterium piperi]|uniref:DUF4861 domain-containing protein n=1 Tax=Chryseobacterium piperi TaxID=558152 RepID=A0A086B9N6_9FLAO|nr:DUF4861 family protein [Chryseobacterium piperi]ATL75927.1 DUF4861 domain-containing protein [Chryseobacterium piperi]KFF25650.1 hypothetical protein IQ37_12065 [Chryseobacterium piperi]
MSTIMNLCSLLIGVLYSAQTLLGIELVNTMPVSRFNQAVEIPLEKLQHLKESTTFVIKDIAGNELPYQWVYQGNKKPQHLLLIADFTPKEIKKIYFSKLTPGPIPSRVSAQQIPERYDDFAWENDKVAFRVYGKALEKKPDENGYGMDVWAKRTSALVVARWYKNADYHTDHGEGLDFFKVGHSLGAGDSLPVINDSLTYLGNYTQYRVLDKGPLRTSFQLFYPPKKINNQSMGLVKTVSLDAGSQLNKVQLEYLLDKSVKLPVFVGLVHWNGKGTKTITDHYVSYWPEADKKNGSIGTAVLFESSSNNFIDRFQHLGNQVQAENKHKITYFAGAAWDKAQEIQSAEDWNSYLKSYGQSLQNPIIINIISLNQKR